MIKVHGITDIIIEWIEEIPETRKHKNIRYLFLIITVTLLVIAFWYGMLGYVLIAIPFFIVFLVMNFRRDVDYEFRYCDGSFMISRVRNESRRKRVFTCEIDSVKYVSDRLDSEAKPKKFYNEDDEDEERKVSTLYLSGGGPAVAFVMDSRFRKVLEVSGKIRR